MRITAPVSRVEEVEVLAAAGADEFYCGVVPPDWVARFGSGAVNRRLFANLKDYAELAEAVAAAHGAGRRLALVLNAQHYAAEQVPALIEMAQRFDGLGGDALIVGDLGVLALIAQAGVRARLHVSSVATCRNAEAARFAQTLGAHRLILPRDVSLDEAGRLARQCPDLEVEAFVLNDGCAYEEGLCQTIHLPQKLGGPICLDRYTPTYTRRDGAALSDAERFALEQNDAAYRRWLWYRTGCGYSVTAAGLPYGPCGLCAMPALAGAGIAAVKIAGREAPTQRKLQSVRLVADVRDRHAAGMPAPDLIAHARSLRDAPQHCASGAMCYYPRMSPDTPALGDPALDPEARRTAATGG